MTHFALVYPTSQFIFNNHNLKRIEIKKFFLELNVMRQKIFNYSFNASCSQNGQSHSKNLKENVAKFSACVVHFVDNRRYRVKSQQQKQQNNVVSAFKINNKWVRTKIWRLLLKGRKYLRKKLLRFSFVAKFLHFAGKNFRGSTKLEVFAGKNFCGSRK